MRKKLALSLLVVLLVSLVVSMSPLSILAQPGLQSRPAEEVVEFRTETSKTYHVGDGEYWLEVSSGILHYKHDYSNPNEQWKDIDTRWDGSYLNTAPYVLERTGEEYLFTDRKTGDCVLISPIGFEVEAIPFNEGVRLARQIVSDKGKLTSQFSLTTIGESVQISCKAVDADGNKVPVEYSIEDNVLTETIPSLVTDKGGEVKFPITMDPTLTVQPPSKDTFLDSSNPDYVWGAGATLAVYDRDTVTYRSILEFSLSGLPEDSVIASSTLSLYYSLYTGSDPVGKTVWAYELSRTDWVEAEATWNSYKSGSSWTAPGGDYVTSDPSGGSTTFPGSYGWMAWNVLDITQDAYDDTNPVELLVRYATEGLGAGYSNSAFNSKEHGTESLRPKLVIVYTAPPEVTNSAATGITYKGAKLHGNIEDNNGGTVTDVGFEWDTDTGAPYTNSWDSSYSDDAFSHTFTDMPPETTIYWRAFGVNVYGTGYSSELSFNTTAFDSELEDPDSMLIENVEVFDDYLDGQLYVIAYKLVYAETPPLSASDFFRTEILDGEVLRATGAVTGWQYRPAAIYLTGGGQLTWGSDYTIELAGFPNKWLPIPSTSYALTASSWRGSDLTELDTWVINLALRMQDYYSVELTLWIPGYGTILNDQGGEIFRNAIPGLATVRPGLFSSGVTEIGVDVEPGSREYEEQVEQNFGEAALEKFEDLGAHIGLGGVATASLLFTLLLVLVVGGLTVITGSGIAAAIVAVPLVAAGGFLGVVPLALIAVFGALLVIFLMASIWLARA